MSKISRAAVNVQNSHGQPTAGGPPAWGLREGLTTAHRIKGSTYKILQSTQNWLVLVKTVLNLRVP